MRAALIESKIWQSKVSKVEQGRKGKERKIGKVG
jgi:hypothetical protein